jgi:hypothetical protein
MNNHYSLDYLKQNSGLYILQIIDEEGKTYNLKIIYNSYSQNK